MAIKRNYYNGQHYVIDRENKVVTLMPEFHDLLLRKGLSFGRGFKKIGGSSLGDVLETSQFASQFTAFCRMANIGLPILDRKYVDAGIAIEPMVVDAIEKMTNSKVETYPGPKYGFDYFKNIDDVFGGLPDGFIKEKNLVIEIKTTGEKNMTKWKEYGVPLSYQKQSQLYSYLMNADKFAIVATFLKEEDYANPENFPIRQRKIKTYTFDVNRAMVEDDMTVAREWYAKHTASGVSPVWKDGIDAELLEWLDCSNEAEWRALEAKWTQMGKISG